MAKPATEQSTFDDRVSRDPAPVTVSDGDVSTSDEAMKVLREEGVEAWQAWCQEHQPTG